MKRADTLNHSSEEAKKNASLIGPVCDLFQAIRAMSVAAQAAVENTQAMIRATTPIETMSRDLRPMRRRLREALTRIVEAREVMNEWVRLMDASSINCDKLDRA